MSQLTNNFGFITGTSANQLYITGTGGISLTSGATSRKVRAPYKKDKFVLDLSLRNSATKNTTSTIGKVLTLNEIGKQLDALDSADELTIVIRKEPR